MLSLEVKMQSPKQETRNFKERPLTRPPRARERTREPLGGVHWVLLSAAMGVFYYRNRTKKEKENKKRENKKE